MVLTETVHLVDGVGTQITHNDEQKFNPKAFEKAIRQLEGLIITLSQLDDLDCGEDNPPTEYEICEEDGMQFIEAEEETQLYKLIRRLPSDWDKSVVNDLVKDDTWGVRASYDCGGGVVIGLSVLLDSYGIYQYRFDLVDPNDREQTLKSGQLHTGGGELARYIRALERKVVEAYVGCLSSPTVALDYVMTMGEHQTQSRRKSDSFSPSPVKWKNARGVTRQTISNNKSDAFDELVEFEDPRGYRETGPALEEIPKDAEDPGVIRLV